MSFMVQKDCQHNQKRSGKKFKTQVFGQSPNTKSTKEISAKVSMFGFGSSPASNAFRICFSAILVLPPQFETESCEEFHPKTSTELLQRSNQIDSRQGRSKNLECQRAPGPTSL